MKTFIESMNYCENTEDLFLELIREYTDATTWKTARINTMELSKSSDCDGAEGLIDISCCLGANDEGAEQLYNAKLAKMGVKSVTERAGIKGPSLMQLKQADFIDVVNKCANVCKGNMNIVEIDGLIYATHSNNYVVLDMYSVFQLSSNEVKKTFPLAMFKSGYLEHKIAVCEYDLSKHDEITSEYTDMMRQIAMDRNIKFNDWNLKPIVRFATSNTGFSGANIYPYFKRGDITIPAGSPITLEHKGDASLNSYIENLGMMYSAVKKAYANIAKLKEITIKHPRKCMQNIANRVGLPKRYAMLAAADYEQFVGIGYSDGLDLYMALSDTLIYAKDSSKADESAILAIQECLLRVLSIDFKEYDLPYSSWDEDKQPKLDQTQVCFQFPTSKTA